MMQRVLISSLSELDGSKFGAAGIIPITIPTIRLEPDKAGIYRFSAAVGSGAYGSLALLSPRSLDMIMPSGQLLEKISKMRIYAIGPTTATSVEKWGLKVSGIPNEFCSEALGSMLVEIGREGRLGRVALVRSSFSDTSLVQRLRGGGVQVDEFRIYSAVADEEGIKEFLRQLQAGVNAVVFISRSSAFHLVGFARSHGMLGRLGELLSQTKVVCLGRETAKGLEGIQVSIIEPEIRSIDGVISKLMSGFG